jgi:REP element-mobilizing transposase RayT
MVNTSITYLNHELLNLDTIFKEKTQYADVSILHWPVLQNYIHLFSNDQRCSFFSSMFLFNSSDMMMVTSHYVIDQSMISNSEMKKTFGGEAK